MRKHRSRNIGYFSAALVNWGLMQLPELNRDLYREKLAKILRKHKFIPHKKEESEQGDYEAKLVDIINNLDLNKPEHTAAGIIEICNSAYNIYRARIIRDSFLERLYSE